MGASQIDYGAVESMGMLQVGGPPTICRPPNKCSQKVLASLLGLAVYDGADVRWAPGFSHLMRGTRTVQGELFLTVPNPQLQGLWVATAAL